MTEITRVDSVRLSGNQLRNVRGDDGLHGTPVVTGVLEGCATKTPRILSDTWQYKLAMCSSQVLDCFGGEAWDF
jgi:hypothetical protein